MTTPPDAAALADALRRICEETRYVENPYAKLAFRIADAALRAKPASEVVDVREYSPSELSAILHGHATNCHLEGVGKLGAIFEQAARILATLAQTPAIEAAALERADPRSFVAHAAGWETWRKLDAAEQRTGQKFSREYRCMAVVQDAIRALGPAK